MICDDLNYYFFTHRIFSIATWKKFVLSRSVYYYLPYFTRYPSHSSHFVINISLLHLSTQFCLHQFIHHASIVSFNHSAFLPYSMRALSAPINTFLTPITSSSAHNNHHCFQQLYLPTPSPPHHHPDPPP